MYKIHGSHWGAFEAEATDGRITGVRPLPGVGTQHLSEGQIRYGRCCHDSHRLRRL